MSAQPDASMLRLLMCGSVDDGKSTLIGRLLHEGGSIFQDQMVTLVADSRRYGTTGDEVDLALVMDGLQAEREQGITIDVAYRCVTIGGRRLVVADTPGHEQYTRNMATAASVCDLAVLLVDARKGVLTQTRRHSLIASLFGIRHVVLAVNKMDLVGFDPDVFASVAASYHRFSSDLGFASVAAIPVSARHGDNVATGSTRMAWYQGPALLPYLEKKEVASNTSGQPFRMAVQWVSRPDPDTRGYCGTIATGRLACGDMVAVPGLGGSVAVSHLLVAGEDRPEASAGDAVTVFLAEPRDVSRGDALAAPSAELGTADQFQARLIWVDAQELCVGRSYLFKLGGNLVPGSLTRIVHRIEVDIGGTSEATTLAANDVALVNVSLQSRVPYTSYSDSRAMGGFVMIDRQSNATVAAGTIDFALTPSEHLHRQAIAVDKAARAAQKGQTPRVVWFTGLSGAGKSTIANLVEQELVARGRHTFLLDGDNLRHGLSRDLGFTAADRVENMRRVAEVAALMTEAGLIVLVSLISPYRAERQAARERFAPGEFLEAFVDAPVDECRRRDVKGLYARADAGVIPNFTGVSAPYEAPLAPDIHLRTVEANASALAHRVVRRLQVS